MYAVMACWVAFFLIFVLQKKPTGQKAAKRDYVSLTGIILQVIGFALVWNIRRDMRTPIVSMPQSLEIVLAVFAVALAAICVWGTLAAVRTLGKQWSLSARLTEDHKLIVTGPYRLVRHPIYASMCGLMIATSIVVSRLWVLAPALILFAVGTLIRIRSEERLLRDQFGADYDNYSRRVRAVLPWPRRF